MAKLFKTHEALLAALVEEMTKVVEATRPLVDAYKRPNVSDQSMDTTIRLKRWDQLKAALASYDKLIKDTTN